MDVQCVHYSVCIRARAVAIVCERQCRDGSVAVDSHHSDLLVIIADSLLSYSPPLSLLIHRRASTNRSPEKLETGDPLLHIQPCHSSWHVAHQLVWAASPRRGGEDRPAGLHATRGPPLLVLRTETVSRKFLLLRASHNLEGVSVCTFDKLLCAMTMPNYHLQQWHQFQGCRGSIATCHPPHQPCLRLSLWSASTGCHYKV